MQDYDYYDYYDFDILIFYYDYHWQYMRYHITIELP